jgi:hypothetical protein
MPMSYSVQANGKVIATYTEFMRAGYHGVRGVDRDGNSQEYSGYSAMSLALETARAHRPATIVRTDGTVASVIS